VYIYFVYTNIIYIFTPWEEITPILKLKIMATETVCTEAESKYQEIHNELLKLELYELAIELTSAFYGYGSERFKAGFDEMKRINNLYK
jgi:hypothetical protein